MEKLGKERVGNWDSSMETYTLPYVKRSKWESAVSHAELNSLLCDDLEGRDGVGDGSGVHEGGDLWIPAADSFVIWQKLAQYCKAVTSNKNIYK